MNDDLTDYERRRAILLWYDLSHFYNLSIKASQAHLKRWELTTAQFDALVQIKQYAPISQKALSEKLLVTKGNITQLIGKMVEKGWVQKKKEWKTNYLSLTPQGISLYEASVTKQEYFQAAQFKALNQNEQKTLFKLLKKLNQAKEHA